MKGRARRGGRADGGEKREGMIAVEIGEAGREQSREINEKLKRERRKEKGNGEERGGK